MTTDDATQGMYNATREKQRRHDAVVTALLADLGAFLDHVGERGLPLTDTGRLRIVDAVEELPAVHLALDSFR